MFILWIALFPFIFLYSVYEGPKVWWLWIGGSILTVSWIIRLFGRRRISIHPQDFWFLGWTGVLALASVLGVHPLDSFVGGSYRHQGVLFFITLWLIMVTCRTIVPRQRSFMKLLLAGGVLAESIIVLIQKMQDFSTRPPGTFGEPNAVAGYIAVGLYFLSQAHLKNWVKYTGYAVGVLAIVMTASRTGIAAAALFAVGMILKTVIRGGDVRKRILAYVFIGCVLAGSFVFLVMISGTRVESAYESRPLFWRLGWQQFVSSPILGYGAESGEIIYNRAFLTINTRLVDFMVDRAHNVFLDIALWSGAAGLAVFLIWLGSVIKELIRSRDVLRMSALLTWIVFAFFQPLGVVHWLCLVLIVSL